jgi:hypothetical protein
MNKFLDDSGTNISDGTAVIYAATIGAANLEASMPVKTNATKQLVSTKLDISDVNNLQTTLNNTISNPFAGELSAHSYVATQGNPNKRIRVTEDTITSDNGAVIAMNTANTINLQATSVLVNGTVLPSAANQTLNITFNSVTTSNIQSGTTGVNIAGNTVLTGNLNVTGTISGFTNITNPTVSITANNSIVLDCVTSVLGLTGNDVSINGTNTNPLATSIMFNGKSQFNNSLNVLGPLVTSGDATFNFGVVQMNGSTVNILNSGTTTINPTGALTLKAFNCTGALAMRTNKITGLGTPTADPDAANKEYVDDQKGVTSVYTTSTLPTAVGKTGQIVYVSNEGNMAFSNNTTWIRMINSTAGWVQPSMTSTTTPAPFIVTNNSTEAPWVPWKGFDGVLTATGNWWHTVTGAFSASGAYIGPATGKAGVPNQGTWLVLEMDRSIPIRRYQLYPRFDNTSGSAKSWHIIYSVDGVTYSVADTKVTQTMTPGTPVDVTFASPISAKYWGVQVYESQDSYMIIQELRFIV